MPDDSIDQRITALMTDHAALRDDIANIGATITTLVHTVSNAPSSKQKTTSITDDTDPILPLVAEMVPALEDLRDWMPVVKALEDRLDTLTSGYAVLHDEIAKINTTIAKLIEIASRLESGLNRS